MGKGSKWRKTNYKQYWGNWPKSMGVKKEKRLTAEQAAIEIVELAKTRKGFLIV